MGAELIVAPEAQQDLLGAYGWYEALRNGLGEDFLTCVDACTQRICRHPELYAKAHADFRRAFVRRFPYVVFYELHDNSVTILGVFHTARDEDKWRERLS